MTSPAAAPILRAAEMRAAEAAAFAGGIEQDALMERAGLAVAREVRRLAFNQPVLVLAGPGNNGGDAFVVARYLAEWGQDVAVASLPGKGDGSAARMRARWTGPVTTLEQAQPCPIMVDGLFGTGVTRPLAPDLADTVARLASDAYVIAIDLPSGVDTDAGHRFDGSLAADLTIALGALKPAHVIGAAACGAVLLADLGIAIASPISTIARPRIAPPPADAHKYRRGLVAVLPGAMPGAARLAARAALSSGAGYVILAGDTGQGGPDALVHRAFDPDLLRDDRLAAVLVGPGLGRDAAAHSLLDAALATPAPLILDGDAISLLGPDGVARIAGRTAATFLTPHEGEFVRMFGQGSANKIDRTLAAAKAARATIVHKGPATVIACSDGHAVVSNLGPSWLSTAGTGDVLAGILAARLRPGGEEAGAQAVWLHAEAARLAGPAFIADDLIGHLGRAIATCR
jgi:hydroxyethylthiazole kinase-like uncharacterized protein yjeF